MGFGFIKIITVSFLLVYSLNSHAKLCRLYLDSKTSFSTAFERENWLSFARKTKANSDFKHLADLVLKKLGKPERVRLIKKAKKYRQKIYKMYLDQGATPTRRLARIVQTAYSRRVLQLLFEERVQLKNLSNEEFGEKLTLSNPAQSPDKNLKDLQSLFKALENMWPHLIQRVQYEDQGSLLPVEDIIFKAGGRFKEGYYWDSYFGSFGLIATNRQNLVFRKLKKFVDDIYTYGFVPNGNRSYYLTRSQPPVISLMARTLYESIDDKDKLEELSTWLTSDALPALEYDYSSFWMKKRLHAETGLNFYSDKLDIVRPEAHSSDKSDEISLTERGVRAEAESGQDFTELFGRRADKTLSVQLNAFLYAYEKNLAWIHRISGNSSISQEYEDKAELRKKRIDFYLRDSEGLYRNYHFDTNELNKGLSGEVFSLLFVEALSKDQADRLVKRALPLLEKEGGIAASTFWESSKQWDGKYGWAPFQIMAVQGLLNYGYEEEAMRLMKKWIETNLKIYLKTGQFYEKVDVIKGDLPEENSSKYPNQVGFLWTNSSIVWMLNKLGYTFQ